MVEYAGTNIQSVGCNVAKAIVSHLDALTTNLPERTEKKNTASSAVSIRACFLCHEDSGL